MIELRTILLAEDNPHDVELTLEALATHNLANNVVVVSDGVEALEYLRREGQYRLRAPGLPGSGGLVRRAPPRRVGARRRDGPRESRVVVPASPCCGARRPEAAGARRGDLAMIQLLPGTAEGRVLKLPSLSLWGGVDPFSRPLPQVIEPCGSLGNFLDQFLG